MYPVMLNVRDRACLVVGGGGVALRKARGLFDEGARVTVVAPEVVEPLVEMAEAGCIHLERRTYLAGEAASYRLVFAATNDRATNQRIFDDAENSGVWANVADDREECSFHLPARVRRGELQLAVASAGSAPFAVRRLRQLLERRIGPEWAEWIDAASRFRDAVMGHDLERPEREASYDRFFAATVDGDRLTARVPVESEEDQWLGAPSRSHREPGVSGRERVSTGGPCHSADNLGMVSLIGSGPGCPGLLTVRGHQRLLDADVVVYDRLGSSALPPELSADVELHCVGKTAGHHPTPQAEINSLLVRLAREGRKVVRLKGGDPYVFGRGGEEAEVLATEGIPFEVVPGITSGIAAPAWIGIPVTHRREAVRLTLVTAHEAIKSDGPQVRWDLLAQDQHATIVGYMGVTALPRVVHELMAYGMDPKTPAAMIEQGTTAGQRRVVSTVRDLPQAVVDAGIHPPAVFIIGPTVGHSEHLDWYGRLPLRGQRLVVPATATDSVRVLELAGADVVAVPLPVTPASRVVMGAGPITGCLVTSPAEVDWLDEERGGFGWNDDAVCWCVGERTANHARSRGWQRVIEIDEGLWCADLVARIGGDDAKTP